MAEIHSLLKLHAARRGSRYVIAPTGELDGSTAPALEEELVKAESSDAERIVVDLSGLTFMDSTGVRLLLRARTDRLRLVPGPARVQRVFELTETDTVLPFLDGDT